MNNIMGQKFNRLTVIAKANSKFGYGRWVCVCECGNEIVSTTNHLKTNQRKSCGCFRKEFASKQFKKHGMTNTVLYQTYMRIKRRCEDVRSPDWKDYGGRGIKNEWKTFEAFYTDMIGSYIKSFSIERIDNNGNYSKVNCKLATAKEQARNKRSNIVIKYDGQKRVLAEWAEVLGLKYKNLYQRMYRGWSFEKAITV